MNVSFSDVGKLLMQSLGIAVVLTMVLWKMV
jgi:hypothetical protein